MSLRLAGLLIAALCATVARAEDSRFAGTWFLDTRASDYGGDEMPSEATMSYEAVPEGVHYRSLTRMSSGRVLTAEFTADLESHLAVVQGAHGLLAPVSLHQPDANTLRADFERGLRTIAQSRSEVSADGSTLTVITTSTDSTGRQVVHRGIYHKIPVAAAAKVEDVGSLSKRPP